MNNYFKSVTITLILVFVISFFYYVGWFRPVEGVIIKTISPIGRIFHLSTLKVKNSYNDWMTKRDLLQELEDVKNQLQESRVNQARVNSLQQENKLLKQELNFVDRDDIKYVSVKIISGVFDPTSKSVIIDRGYESGIAEGMAAVSGDGIIVGKIIEVGNRYSKVLIITDNQSRLAATVQNKDQTVGLVEGRFGLGLEMTNIAQNEIINEGDLVITSGLEGNIPRGLLIGVVTGINMVENEIFKTAALTPAVDLDNLSYLTVIIQQND